MQKAKEEILRVLLLESAALQVFAGTLDKDPSPSILNAVQLILETLAHDGKVVVTGIGKSGKIAEKIASTLTSTGTPAVFIHSTEATHGDLGILNSKDCVLALSHTGNTDEVVQLLPSLKKMKVPIIGIGGNPESKLATQCQVWIQASVEQEACPLNLAPTTSTTLALAIGDAIAVALMKIRNFKPEEFAVNHPGGSLGKRLLLQVKDLMQPIETISLVSSSAPMDHVLLESTRTKQGAVLVIDQNILAGIITDGDIRRALSHREKFFLMTAGQIMTHKPTVIRSDVLAHQALDTMENRPSQISVLPVVDAKNQAIGLIRLHDLVRAL